MNAIQAPQQERSSRSLSRMLDAAERLMMRDHFEDISIAAIAAEAGTSVGNFYARFPSKEALLDALHERYEEDRNAAWAVFFQDAASAKMGLQDRARAFAAMVIKMYRARSGVFRTLLMRQWRYPTKLKARSRKSLGRLYEDGAAFLLACRREITHTDAERAVNVALASLLAACRDNVVMRHKSLPGSLSLSDNELGEELSRMMYLYLSAPRSRRS